ncbi:ribonucleotide reductase [Brevibacillus panacihumi W25]|uniref:Protein NrdI n=2 Tax=Brevibacillus panacihumi TaxID=497735 RepID=V6M0Y6_9BACL|nr:ribonucleotide reductase [Brevibacillus panacihumi W25]
MFEALSRPYRGSPLDYYAYSTLSTSRIRFFHASQRFGKEDGKMMIAYDSRTGNVQRFVDKLNDRLPSVQIQPDLRVDKPFVLITYTTGFGQVPEKVEAFLADNHAYLRGVAASGNRNWGANFAKSADWIAQRYRVPVLAKFELSGTTRDLESFQNEVTSIAAY